MVAEYSHFFLKVADYIIEVSKDTFYNCLDQIKSCSEEFDYYYDPVYFGCKCTEFIDSTGENHFFGEEMTEEYYKDVYLKECRCAVCGGCQNRDKTEDYFGQKHIVDRALNE